MRFIRSSFPVTSALKKMVRCESHLVERGEISKGSDAIYVFKSVCVRVSPKLDLNSNLFKISTVEINNKITTDLAQRNSHFHSADFHLSTGIRSNNSDFSFNGPWKLLKYEKGQFFHSHTDTKESENHLYTALLLPSNSFSRYTGGELFIHDKSSFEESTEKIVISCADLDKDTLVVFPIGFYHEVLPVLEGVRYAFKKPLLSSVSAVESDSSDANLEFFPLENTSNVVEDVMVRLKKQHESRQPVVDPDLSRAQNEVKLSSLFSRLPSTRSEMSQGDVCDGSLLPRGEIAQDKVKQHFSFFSNWPPRGGTISEMTQQGNVCDGPRFLRSGGALRENDMRDAVDAFLNKQAESKLRKAAETDAADNALQK